MGCYDKRCQKLNANRDELVKSLYCCDTYPEKNVAICSCLWLNSSWIEHWKSWWV
jgi:hypothetical protein